ncbi:MAG: DUF2384 domain-containing protein [Alphaproteobacteria bacterium]|nr:MAG: DUF2384 domain-containing protein [Alphaproteobacteria bacterium]
MPDSEHARAKETLLSKLGQMIEDGCGVRDDSELAGWLDTWLAEPLPELNGATPAQLLLAEGGQQQVEGLLERMRGGLPG